MNLDNLSQIIELRSQMVLNSPEGQTHNKFSTDGTNLLGSAGKNPRAQLKTHDRPSMPPGGMMVMVTVFMMTAFVQLLVLIYDRDTIITMMAFCGLYGSLVVGHYYVVDKKVRLALKEQDLIMSFTSGRFKTDFVLTASVAALSFAIVTILYSSNIPFGPYEIDIYLPAAVKYIIYK